MAFKAARGKIKHECSNPAKGQIITRTSRCQIIFQDVQQNYRLKNLTYMAFSSQHSSFKFSPTQWNSYTQEVLLACYWDIFSLP